MSSGKDAYVNAVLKAPNFAEANQLAMYLPKIEGLSPRQVASLVQAYNTNSQVRGAFGFEDALAPRLSEITGEQYVVWMDSYQEPRIHRVDTGSY